MRLPIITPIPSAGWLEAARWLLLRRRRVRVNGRSMWPLLQPGDELLVATKGAVHIGDLVVARHPFRGDVHVIKRLAGWDARGHLRLLGDNPDESSDSRTLGNLAPRLLVGRVTSRLGSRPMGSSREPPVIAPVPE